MSNDLIAITGMLIGIIGVGCFAIPRSKYMIIGGLILISGFIISFYGQFFM